ncbi:MAG: nitrate reductase [Planctomycetota bacterium]|nr:nitrate reductase [Planctomycetota bacterium]
MSAPGLHSGESVCPYCGVGCRLWVEAEGSRLIRVKGVPDAAANRGRLCHKGATLWHVVDTPDRLRFPLQRTLGGKFRRISWPKALKLLSGRLRALHEAHGADALAFYGSGQLDTETAYLICKLFKGYLGANNTDSNSRLCMASAAVAYATALGSDGPPTCYEDIAQAETLLVLGSNMAEAHPVAFDLLRQRLREDAGARLIVIDPRRTPTAERAHLHLPLKPGSDLALLNALALLLRPGADRGFIARHASGFEAYEAFLDSLDLEALIKETGLAAEQVRAAAELLRGRRFLTFYCMGANQSREGVAKNLAILNLHLLTGQIGTPGAGPFSLTGQPNAMGGREAGLLAHQLPGYRFVADAGHRGEVEDHWGYPRGSISARPGLTAVEMFRALERGRLKALWIAGTNPAASMPDLHQIKRAFAAAEFVVVQDCYHPTETTLHADLILPAAQWVEKAWTGTNSERMVSYSPRLVEPVGEALPDFEILRRAGAALGAPGFDAATRESVWDEYRLLTAGRPCDQAGISAERLKRVRELQWPCPHEAHPGTLRRYLDRNFPTPDGRARFHPVPARGPLERTDAECPLVLTTGRLAAHWHTRTRTGKVASLNFKAPGPILQIHPLDAQARGIQDGATVVVSNRRGFMRVVAEVTETILPGTVFSTFHWGDLHAPHSNANLLTHAALDPLSKQPEYKFAAVEVVLDTPARMAEDDRALPQAKFPAGWFALGKPRERSTALKPSRA